MRTIDHSSYDKNKEYSLQQVTLGMELEQLIRATVPTRGNLLDPFRRRPAPWGWASGNSRAAAGFWHDQGGAMCNWFRTVGKRKVTLDSGEIATVPDWVHVPSPGAAPTSRSR